MDPECEDFNRISMRIISIKGKRMLCEVSSWLVYIGRAKRGVLGLPRGVFRGQNHRNYLHLYPAAKGAEGSLETPPTGTFF